MNLLWSRKRCR